MVESTHYSGNFDMSCTLALYDHTLYSLASAIVYVLQECALSIPHYDITGCRAGIIL